MAGVLRGLADGVLRHPFSVGDQVTWLLVLNDPDEVLGGGWSAELGEITATVDLVPGEDGPVRLLRADDGLAAALAADPCDPDAPDAAGGQGGPGDSRGPGGSRDDRGNPGDLGGPGDGDGGNVGEDGAGAGAGLGRRVRRTGLLTVERHSSGWPGTTGIVRTIHLVRRDVTDTAPGSRTGERAPATLSSEAVDRSPKWFGEDGAGVLAELDVPDPRT